MKMKDVDIFFFYELCSLLSQTLLIVKKLFEKQNLKLYFANCKNKNCILLISQNFLNIPMQIKNIKNTNQIQNKKNKDKIHAFSFHENWNAFKKSDSRKEFLNISVLIIVHEIYN